MLEFAIDGHDGAAKTPILQAVEQQLVSAGLRVWRCAPFHIANAQHGGDVYPLWAHDDSTRQLLERLRDVLAGERRLAQEENAQVLLFDRHWMTILVEIDGRQAVGSLWVDFVPTFFVQAPPSKTKACDRFSYDLGWTSSDERVDYYYHRYLDIARRYPQFLLGQYEVVHKRHPLDPIVTDVTQKILDRFRGMTNVAVL